MLIPVVLTFISVFLLVSSIFFALITVKDSPSFALKMRLRRLARDKTSDSLSDDLRSEILKEALPFEQYLRKIFLFRNLHRKLEQCGIKIQPHSFIIYSATAAFFPAIGVYIFYHKAVVALLTGLIILAAIAAALHFLKARREEKLTEQLPDVLMTIARSLRAGHSLSSAVELVGLETPDPTGELFKTAYEQQKLGLRITETLSNMLDRVESLDLRFFITTVTINAETGGNLAEILDKLADTIRQRLQVRRQVKVYTAQGRFSGYVLVALPIIMFILLNAVNPGYEQLLIKEKIGNYLLMGAACMQLIGYLFIRKIIKIRI